MSSARNAPCAIVVNAGTKITINVGGSKIELSSTGVTIDATSIKLTGNSGNILELATAQAKLTGATEVVVTGPMGVKLNS